MKAVDTTVVANGPPSEDAIHDPAVRVFVERRGVELRPALFVEDGVALEGPYKAEQYRY